MPPDTSTVSDELRRSGRLDAIGGLLTQNEARQGMGYDALPDGDRYLWELTGTPPPIAAAPPKKPTGLGWTPPVAKATTTPDDPLDGAAPQDWQGRLEVLEQLYRDYRAGQTPPETPLTEARCPGCTHKLAENVNRGARIQCRSCRAVVEVT